MYISTLLVKKKNDTPCIFNGFQHGRLIKVRFVYCGHFRSPGETRKPFYLHFMTDTDRIVFYNLLEKRIKLIASIAVANI